MEVKNKKAYFDYEIIKELEAGIELVGTEIKSVRKGSVDLKDSFVTIKNREAFVINMYIAKYEEGNIFNHEERRTRKLLLHKEEIKRLKEAKEKEGISIIPLKMYLKNNIFALFKDFWIQNLVLLIYLLAENLVVLLKDVLMKMVKTL